MSRDPTGWQTHSFGAGFYCQSCHWLTLSNRFVKIVIGNWEDFGIFIPRIVPFSSTTRQGHKKLHFLGCCCEPKQRAREEAFLDQTSALLCVHPCDPGLVVGDLPRVEVVPGHCLERRQTGPCPGSGQTVGPMLRLLHFCQLVGRSTLRSREN